MDIALQSQGKVIQTHKAQSVDMTWTSKCLVPIESSRMRFWDVKRLASGGDIAMVLAVNCTTLATKNH